MSGINLRPLERLAFLSEERSVVKKTAFQGSHCTVEGSRDVMTVEGFASETVKSTLIAAYIALSRPTGKVKPHIRWSFPDLGDASRDQVVQDGR